jgi:hypothetical protein
VSLGDVSEGGPNRTGGKMWSNSAVISTNSTSHSVSTVATLWTVQWTAVEVIYKKGKINHLRGTKRCEVSRVEKVRINNTRRKRAEKGGDD